MWIVTEVVRVFVGVWKCGSELELLRCSLLVRGNVDRNWICEGVVCWYCVEMWIGTGVVKVLFVGIVWECGSELELCGNVDRNWSCERVVCWCCVEMWIGTGVVNVLFVGVWKFGSELEL
jgi:hypothetical protein